MKRFTLAMICLCLLFGMVGFSHAQDEGLSNDETKLLDIINDALHRVFEQKWVHQTLTQVVEQTIGIQGMTIDQTLITESVSDTQYAEDGTINAMQAVSNQSIDQGMSGGESTLTLEIVFVDGEVFMRSPEGTGIYASFYPADWTNLSAGETFGGLEQMLDMDSYIEQLLGDSYLKFYYDESFVTGVTVLEPVEIDGVTLNVYEVSIDSNAFFATEEAQSTLSMFSLDAFAGVISEEEMLQFLEDLFAGVELGLVFYLNPETETLQQFEMSMLFDGDLTLMGQTMSMLMDSTMTSTLSFGEPVTIEAPR